MHDTSARLVERVLPVASYRQWVLTVPFPLRLRIARDPGELSRVLNLFHRALRAERRRRARWRYVCDVGTRAEGNKGPGRPSSS